MASQPSLEEMLSLCHAMKAYSGELKLHAFLTFQLDKDEFLATRFSCFIVGENPTETEGHSDAEEKNTDMSS
jgi:hypothetical protein